MNWLKRKLLVAYLTLYKFPPLLWLVAFRIEKQRADKFERLLMAAYRKAPIIHYENCSKYARERLFTKPDADGWVEYLDPNVQTVEPP